MNLYLYKCKNSKNAAWCTKKIKRKRISDGIPEDSNPAPLLGTPLYKRTDTERYKNAFLYSKYQINAPYK